MDAAVLPSCPHAESVAAPIPGAESARAADIPPEILQCRTRFEDRADQRQAIWCPRRNVRGNESAGAFRPVTDFLDADGSRARRHSAEPPGGALHCIHHAAPRATSTQCRNQLDCTARNAGCGLPGLRAAAHAAARIADRRFAGIQPHRFPRCPRFLSSIYGGRAFAAHHRAFAGIGRSSGRARRTLSAVVADRRSSRSA